MAFEGRSSNSHAGPAIGNGLMTGGRASRQKGDRFERAIVRLLQDRGLGAERVPLSGSAGGSYSGDLTVPILGRDLVVEAKARGNGFARLYTWLEGRDALIIKADRRDALVVLPLRLAAEIAMAAERGKSPKNPEFPGAFRRRENSSRAILSWENRRV
jgi:Holliday junction resolvase